MILNDVRHDLELIATNLKPISSRYRKKKCLDFQIVYHFLMKDKDTITNLKMNQRLKWHYVCLVPRPFERNHFPLLKFRQRLVRIYFFPSVDNGLW